jgi:LuxR family maltose regulon positive regulatory protein
MNEQSAILVRTKLNVPTINHKIIKRAKVLKKLQQSSEYRLTLITAPVGSGKTTAVASYLAEADLPYVWLSVDESDNDPVRFWRYILAAIQGLGNFGKNYWEIPVKQELITSNIQADMLLDKLYTLPGKAVIVLDDYHLITNEIIHSSLTYFLKYLPSHFRMIILSRKEPEIKIIREYTNGQVCKLDFRDLAFDRREVGEFFKIRGYQLNSEEIAAVRDYTEGWAAGLVMTSLSMEEEGDVHAAIRKFSGKNRRVGQLFQDEVFDRWPDRVKDFLVRIAFLDKFCGPLCEAVTGLADSTEYLKKLAQGNSFIFYLDQENEWFRFHHLFGDFLQRRLAREDQALRRELYLKAGEWYRENGLVREAVEVFIKAEAFKEAFPLLLDTDFYLSMVQNGDFSAWLTWMGCIPAEYYEGEVRACTGYSWVLSMENRTDEAKFWADKAQSCFDRIKDGITADEKDFMAANVIMVKANIAILEMDMERAGYYYKQAGWLKLYQPIVIGELNSGEASILKTAYSFRGRLKKFDELYALLVSELPRLIGNFSTYLMVGMAECQYERNNLQNAYRTLTQVMENILELGNPGAIVPCVITLAKIKRAEGDIEGAIQTIAEGRKKLAGKSKTLWNYFFDIFTAGLYIDRHDATAASEWLNIDRIGLFDNLSYTREYEFLTFTRYLNLVGRYDDALLLLDRLNGFTRKEDRLGSRIEVLCQTAISHQLKGDSVNAMETLDEALALGIEDGYLRTFIDHLEPMAELLAKYKNWKKRTGTDARSNYAKKLFRLVQGNILAIKTKLPAVREVPSLTPLAAHLSVREFRILRLLAADRSNKEIAAELCISVRTVKYHNSQIFGKLGVENRLQAIRIAWETGILE